MVNAVNSLAVSLLRYSGGVVFGLSYWTLIERPENCLLYMVFLPQEQILATYTWVVKKGD